MLTQLMLEDAAQYLASRINSAEIEINGVIKPVTFTTSVEGTIVKVTLSIPAQEVGIITNRILKNPVGQIVWSERQETVRIEKSDTDITTTIPIDLTWEEKTHDDTHDSIIR